MVTQYTRPCSRSAASANLTSIACLLHLVALTRTPDHTTDDGPLRPYVLAQLWPQGFAPDPAPVAGSAIQEMAVGSCRSDSGCGTQAGEQRPQVPYVSRQAQYNRLLDIDVSTEMHFMVVQCVHENNQRLICML